MPLGSRTLVTKLTVTWSYRFFLVISSEYSHAQAVQQDRLSAAPLRQSLSSRHHAPGLFTYAPRGHFWFTAKRSRGRMLLPLFGIARARWLRENVRFETARLTLVGNDLRETSHAYPGR